MSGKDIVKPYEGVEPYVFVSYCAADREIVLDIIADLSRRGYRVWYEPARSAIAGNPELVAERIQNCEVFMAVLSEGFNHDRQCAMELNYAVQSCKTVLPIQIEQFTPSPETGYYLSSMNRLVVSEAGSGTEMTDRICEAADQLLVSCREEAEPPAAAKSGGGGGYTKPTGSGKPEKPAPKPERKPGFFERLTGRRKNREHQEAEKASFSVLSPKAVKPDSYGIIQLHMYTDAERGIVDRAIEEAGGVVNETAKTGFEVEKGISVTARLESDDVEIRDNLETQVWNGKHLLYDFRFYVPQDYPRSQAAFTCYIECNGIPVTRLNFLVAVMRVPDQQAVPTKVVQNDYNKAFISYSRKDEQRMLERVLGIRELAPNMVFWLDKQSLDAGDLWREEIRKAILISDVLLLFWSVAASKSKEVEQEWRFGFEQKGLSFIAPVPLDPPSECPPPDSLKPLNFTVRAFSANEITKQLSFYNSDNIRLI